jgi:hypothetical protein
MSKPLVTIYSTDEADTELNAIRSFLMTNGIEFDERNVSENPRK